MVYHSLTIRPDHVYEQETVERDTILKSVSLTPYVNEKNERASLVARFNGGEEVTICTLLVGRNESRVLNMPLKRGTKLTLSVEGGNDVDALFYEIDEEYENENENDGGYMSLTVQQGERAVIREKVDLKILNAALKDSATKEKTILYLQGEEKDIPLVHFLPGRIEEETLDLEIEAGNEVVLGVKGPGKIDILILRGPEIDLGAYDSNGSNESELETELSESGELSESNSGETELSESNSGESGESAKLIQSNQPSQPSQPNQQELTANSTPTKRSDRKRVFSEDAEEVPLKRINTREGTEKISSDTIAIPNTGSDTSAGTTSVCSQAEEVPITITSAATTSSTTSNAVTNTTTEEDGSEISVIFEGVGKLIGRRSIFSAKYSISNGDVEEEHEESIVVRKLHIHPSLNQFSKIVRGMREGAIIKAVKKRDQHSEECTLKIGKLLSNY